MPNDARPSIREFPLVMVALAAVGVAAYGVHVLHGGLYSDDWSNAAAHDSETSPRYLHAVHAQAVALGARPLLAAVLPLPSALFGHDATPQLVLALVLGVALSGSFYLLLRALGMQQIHAFALAALALLFPWSDSTVLWPAASLNSLSLTFAFIGGWLALRSVSQGRSPWSSWHLASASLFVASILTYEITGLALLLFGSLYLGRTSRGRAFTWWFGDVLAVGAALAYTAATTKKIVPSLADRLHAVPTYVRESVTLTLKSFVPPGLPAGATSLFLALALVFAMTVILLAVRHLHSRDRSDAVLRRWLAVTVVAVVGIGSAYAVGLGSYLQPLSPGIGNRVNLLAGFGYVAFVYAVAMLAARLVALRTTTPERTFAPAATALALLIGCGYLVRLEQDAASWDRAANEQSRVLDVSKALAAGISRRSTVIALGARGEVRDGIPVFNAPWDLDAALKLETGNRWIRGYLVDRHVTLTCRQGGINLRYPNSLAEIQSPYGNLWIVDIRDGSRFQITSKVECLDAPHVLE